MTNAPDDEWADGVPTTFGSGPSDPIRLADEPGASAEEIDIAAPTGRVWEISDRHRPACPLLRRNFLGASWTDGGPALEAAFVGRNRHPAIGEWEVESYIDTFVPGRSFGWATVDRTNPGSRWRFDLTPDGKGARLRYSMSMGPGPSGISVAIESMPQKEPRILRRRILEHHVNMVRTIEGIRALAEATA